MLTGDVERSIDSKENHYSSLHVPTLDSKITFVQIFTEQHKFHNIQPFYRSVSVFNVW